MVGCVLRLQCRSIGVLTVPGGRIYGEFVASFRAIELNAAGGLKFHCPAVDCSEADVRKGGRLQDVIAVPIADLRAPE